MNHTSVLEMSAAPVGRRIAALDVVRGVAILGTLWTNIWLFSHQYGLAGVVLGSAEPAEADGLVQSALMALSQGKFLALLTLMFGMGLAIQHDSATRRGARWPGRYLWRATLLLIDGVINYLLIAEFDVLMGYAVTAAIVAAMLVASPRAQRRLMLGFAAAHAVLFTALAALASQLPAEPQVWQGGNPYAEAGFWELAAFRLDNLLLFRAEPVLIGFGSVAMFLLGARLYRAGVFSPEARPLRRRMLIVGAVAWPVDLLLGVAGGAAGLLLQRYLTAPLVAFGLLTLVIEACLRWGTDGWAARRLREVGRTALSCYLLQNLLAGASTAGGWAWRRG